MPIHEKGNKLLPGDKSKLATVELRQVDLVKGFFFEHPNEYCSAEDVHRQVLPHCPLTSVRRCMTDLLNAGFLEKDSAVRKQGKYGISIVTYIYKITSPKIASQLKMFS